MIIIVLVAVLYLSGYSSGYKKVMLGVRDLLMDVKEKEIINKM